jgi:superfamily II DNA/RNA helicase
VIKRGEEDYVEIDHKPRLKVLLEEIGRASTKVIVVVPFKGIIRTLEKEMTDAGYSVEILNGDVSRTQRREIIKRFKDEVKPDVLLCHPVTLPERNLGGKNPLTCVAGGVNF